MNEKFDFKKYIEESNAAFDAASPEQKRVIIAQDVIVRIKNDNLDVRTGHLLIVKGKWGRKNSESLKEIINNNPKDCEVCAKGALFCSIIGRVNQFNIGDLDGQNTITSKEHKELLKYFTEAQLDLIETAFEGRSFLNEANSSNPRAQKYFWEYDNVDDRLIVICENIIANNGEFIP